MKRLAFLTGLVLLLAAGTASAQTSVELSIGFGVPRPYVSGYVLIGRPHVRPVYRPFLYHRWHHRPLVVVAASPFYRSRPRVIVVGRGHRRARGHGWRGGHEWRDDRD